MNASFDRFHSDIDLSSLYQALLKIHQTPELTTEQARNKLEEEAKYNDEMGRRKFRSSITFVPKPPKSPPLSQALIDHHMAKHSRKQLLSQWLLKAQATLAEIPAHLRGVIGSRIIFPVQKLVASGQPFDLSSILEALHELSIQESPSPRTPPTSATSHGVAAQSRSEPSPQPATSRRAIGLDELLERHPEVKKSGGGPVAVLRVLISDLHIQWSQQDIAVSEIFKDAMPKEKASKKSIGRWLLVLSSEGLAQPTGERTAKRWFAGEKCRG